MSIEFYRDYGCKDRIGPDAPIIFVGTPEGKVEGFVTLKNTTPHTILIKNIELGEEIISPDDIEIQGGMIKPSGKAYLKFRLDPEVVDKWAKEGLDFKVNSYRVTKW